MYRKKTGSSYIRNPAAYAAACAKNAAMASVPVLKGKGTYRRKKAAARAPRQPRSSGQSAISKVLEVAADATGLGSIYKIGKAAIDLFTGRGDYRVKRNSILHPTLSEQVPAIGDIAGGTRVRHREFIEDIKSSTSFLNREYPIQPGDASVFPWLASLANNFEQYEIEGMVFEFKSTSADALNSTNTALGTVIMSTQYNSLAPAFTNKQQMENNVYTVSTKPSESIIHPIECEPSQTSVPTLYTYNGAVPPDGDLRLYNMGVFQLATVGMQAANVTIGELWVSYDIKLKKPQLDQGTAAAAQTALYNFRDGTTTGSALLTGTYPLGTPGTAEAQEWFDSIGLTINITSRTITLPVGSNGVYYVQIGQIGQALLTPTVASFANPTLTNAVFVSADEDVDPFWYIGNPVTVVDQGAAGMTPAQVGKYFCLRVVNNTEPVVITVPTGGTPPGTNNAAFVFVQQLNGNFPDNPDASSLVSRSSRLVYHKSPRLAKHVKPQITAAAATSHGYLDDYDDDDCVEEMSVPATPSAAVPQRRRSQPKVASRSLLKP